MRFKSVKGYIYNIVKSILQRYGYMIANAMNIPLNKVTKKILQDYTTILVLSRSDISRPQKETGEAGKVLFFSSAAGFLHLLQFELALYRLLQKRGYNCELIICDRFMDMCEMMNIEQSKYEKKQVCKRCFLRAKDALNSVNIPFIRASEIISPNVRAKILQIETNLESYDTNSLINLIIDDIPVGEIALASSLRFLRRGILPEKIDDYTKKVLIGYLRSAIRIKYIAEEYLKMFKKPDFVVMTHGIYVPWGPAFAVFRREGIPVACYDQSNVFKEAYVASWNKPSQAYDFASVFFEEKGQPLDEHERSVLHDYIRTRRENLRDRTKFNFVPEEPGHLVRMKLDIPSEAICFGLFSNLLWDAATVGKDICFNNQIEWIIETVKYFIKHPEKYLILRTHPAEEIRGTRQSAIEVVKNAFPKLPSNIKLIGKKLQFNVYSIFNAIDVGIVNTSTVGLEMSLLGKPVIVVSDAHYRGKGFTFDPKNKKEYFEMIDSFYRDMKLRDDQLQEAERYAYMYFFRHHIKMSIFKEDISGKFIVDATLKEDINTQAFINALCEQKPFVLPRNHISK